MESRSLAIQPGKKVIKSATKWQTVSSDFPNPWLFAFKKKRALARTRRTRIRQNSHQLRPAETKPRNLNSILPAKQSWQTLMLIQDYHFSKRRIMRQPWIILKKLMTL